MSVLLCSVCGDAPHKYKCPKCSVKYCSVACYKNHKGNVTQPPQPPPETQAEKAVAATVDNDIVTDEMFKRIAESDSLKAKLRNGKFQDLIRLVDGSETEENDTREEVLTRLMKADPDFAEAVKEMVDVVMGEAIESPPDE